MTFLFGGETNPGKVGWGGGFVRVGDGLCKYHPYFIRGSVLKMNSKEMRMGSGKGNLRFSIIF